MMDKNTYRGKRKDNGEWVYGDLVHYPDSNNEPHTYIWVGTGKKFPLSIAEYEVIPETVGQCTGLEDKNGKAIFEGDTFNLDDDLVALVIFKDGSYRLEVYGLCGTYTESGYDECGGGWGIVECDPIDWYYVKDMEIIGTIHDNPEILEGA